MITAIDNSWRYLGIPRTGSTSLHAVLQQPPFLGIYSGSQHDMQDLPNARIMVSVRNPYNRIVSLWRHRRYDLGRPLWTKKTGPIAVTEDEYPFRQFIREGIEEKTLEPFFYNSMCEWLLKIPVVSVVLHQETLWPDLEAAFPEYGGDPVWDKPYIVNISRRAKVTTNPFFDKECLRIVEKWAKEDCERFGYPRIAPANLNISR